MTKYKDRNGWDCSFCLTIALVEKMYSTGTVVINEKSSLHRQAVGGNQNFMFCPSCTELQKSQFMNAKERKRHFYVLNFFETGSVFVTELRNTGCRIQLQVYRRIVLTDIAKALVGSYVELKYSSKKADVFINVYRRCSNNVLTHVIYMKCAMSLILKLISNRNKIKVKHLGCKRSHKTAQVLVGAKWRSQLIGC